MRLWNFRGEQNSITDALQLVIPEHAVISVTGAGGKTTFVTSWARELASSGKRVVITTTTHMADPACSAEEPDSPYEGIPVIYTDGLFASDLLTEIDRSLAENEILMVVSHDPDKPVKVTSLPAGVLKHLCTVADAVLIEADGARRMPLKWPAPWEPVVPDNTDITVCVAGLSALGKNTAEVMYRAEHLPEGLRRGTVDLNLVRSVVASLEGGQKNARGEYRVFLNQADTEELQITAASLQQMLGACGIQSAWGTLNF